MDAIYKHAPLKQVKGKAKAKSLPWFDHDLLLARRSCDKLFKKSSNIQD
jgi:hypothetical protein